MQPCSYTQINSPGIVILFKRTALSLVLALLGSSAFAAASDYYVVVPVKGRAVSNSVTVSLSAATLPGGLVGTAYSYDFKPGLVVTGDASFTGAGVSWGVTAGTLPTGLALDASTGVLSGTPTAAGSSSFEVGATYRTKGGTQAYALQVSAPVVTVTVTATNGTDFGTVMVGSSVSRQFTIASTGNAPATSVRADITGSQKAGVSITANTCGTPASQGVLAAGSTCSVTVTYAPTVVTPISANLRIMSSASPSVLLTPLTGSGALPAGFASVAGLTWAYSDTAVTYSSAATYCQNLTAMGGGWRLPTLTEANLIADSSTNRDALLAAGWGNTQWNWMWTTTLYSAGNYYVWRTDSMSGTGNWTSYSPPTVPYKVSCVK